MDTHVIGMKYKVGKQISCGSFGILRLGKDTRSNESVAVKLELKKTKEPTLHLEYRFLKLLSNMEQFPKVLYFGSCGHYNALVMELLGPSLMDCLGLCGGKFELKTTVQVSLQTISLMELIHSKGIIHRDLKPDNFLLGRMSKPPMIRLIDFGLAKEYIDRTTKNHIVFKVGKRIVGNARYMSINSHLRYEQSRRDDLEALGYVLLYFLRGDLPWQRQKIDPRDKYKLIGDIKQKISVESLCEGQPVEFLKYMKYVRGLNFDETPNYDNLRTLMIELFNSREFEANGVYEWEQVMQKKDLELEKKTSSPARRTRSDQSSQSSRRRATKRKSFPKKQKK